MEACLRHRSASVVSQTETPFRFYVGGTAWPLLTEGERTAAQTRARAHAFALMEVKAQLSVPLSQFLAAVVAEAHGDTDESVEGARDAVREALLLRLTSVLDAVHAECFQYFSYIPVSAEYTLDTATCTLVPKAGILTAQAPASSATGSGMTREAFDRASVALSEDELEAA